MYPINNYTETALRMKNRAFAADRRMAAAGGTMGYDELLSSMQRECTLLQTLITSLEKEVEYVINGDIESLEESLPAKKKILDEIMNNRAEVDLLSMNPPAEYATELRSLKLELSKLWKKAGALNDNSKDMVTNRLSDINMRLEPFLKALKTGYDKSGKVSKSVAHTIKPGV